MLRRRVARKVTLKTLKRKHKKEACYQRRNGEDNNGVIFEWMSARRNLNWMKKRGLVVVQISCDALERRLPIFLACISWLISSILRIVGTSKATRLPANSPKWIQWWWKLGNRALGSALLMMSSSLFHGRYCSLLSLHCSSRLKKVRKCETMSKWEKTIWAQQIVRWSKGCMRELLVKRKAQFPIH